MHMKSENETPEWGTFDVVALGEDLDARQIGADFVDHRPAHHAAKHSPAGSRLQIDVRPAVHVLSRG